jgi:hypothetical protein
MAKRAERYKKSLTEVGRLALRSDIVAYLCVSLTSKEDLCVLKLYVLQ